MILPARQSVHIEHAESRRDFGPTLRYRFPTTSDTWPVRPTLDRVATLTVHHEWYWANRNVPKWQCSWLSVQPDLASELPRANANPNRPLLVFAIARHNIS